MLPSTATSFDIFNADSGSATNDDAEFLFNMVYREAGGSDEALYFYYPSNFYTYRNTFKGNIRFRPDLSSGPHYFYHNALMGVLIDETYVTSTDNLTASYATAVADSDGKLTATYAANVGTHGWQFADGSTPMDGVFIPPQAAQGRTPFSPSSRAPFSPTSFAPYSP